MNTITNIHNNIINIEYGLNKPASLIVLVPLLAPLIRNLQLNQIPKPRNPDEIAAYDRNIYPINKYHFFGALIQTIAWIALSSLASPIFSLCALASLAQAFYSGRCLIGTQQISFNQHTGFEYLPY